MEDFSFAMLPATWAVDFIPFCELMNHTELSKVMLSDIFLVKYLPSWFPGAGFINIAKKYEARSSAFSDVPYEFVKGQMKTGHFVPSFLSNLLERNHERPGSVEEKVIKWSAASLYAGGADTVSTKWLRTEHTTNKILDRGVNFNFFPCHGSIP